MTRHVLSHPVAALALPQVRSAALDSRLREMERDGAAPATVNKLRSVLRTVFSRGLKAGLWAGANTLASVEVRRVPERAYDTLRADEVAPLLSHVPEWRGLFAAALYTGMRKGEPFGLRRADVDLAEGRIVVRRSYDRASTKGGHADALPIAPPLVCFIVERRRAGGLGFPSNLRPFSGAGKGI